AADAGGLKAGLFKGLHDFILVHVAHGLDALEARRLDRLELLQHGAFVTDGGVHDGLLELAFLLGLVVRGKCARRRERRRARAELQEVASMGGVRHWYAPRMIAWSCE